MEGLAAPLCLPGRRVAKAGPGEFLEYSKRCVRQGQHVRRNAAAIFLSPRAAWLAAILLSLVHVLLAVTAANRKSPTFDEPQHLTAGYSFFATKDFRLDPENGTLPAVWAALPLLFDHLNFIPLNDRGWRRAEEGRTAHQFFYEAGNDPDRMIAEARFMMSIVGVALCVLIYRIGSEFFGVVGGLIAEILVAFDPNFLAHSPLVDSDAPAAFFFTATVWTCWRLFKRITLYRLFLAALSFCGLFLTKFSAPLVLPILGAMSILQIFSANEVEIGFARFKAALNERWNKLCAIGACWLALGAVLFVSIWASCSFRYAAWSDNALNHEGTTWHWSYLLEDHGLFEDSIGFARTHHLLPEAYLYGLAYVRKHEIDRPAFLDNEWSILGFRSFFPLAFLYKTPLPCLLLLLVAIYAAIANRHSWRIENVFNPLWGFAFLYAGVAVMAQLNIGHRHLLPIYPPLFIACGVVVHLLRNPRRPLFASVITLLLFWQVGESLAARPHYLAYFNQIAGGSSRGYQHLVDSSLDWGQDLPELKTWIDNHRSIVRQRPIYLAYFGTADPRAYQVDAESLSPGSQFSHTPSNLRGGIYCISATTLQSVYALEIGPWCTAYERRYRMTLAGDHLYRDQRAPTAAMEIANGISISSGQKMNEFQRMRLARLCAYLRHHEPIAQIGYSILVFDLSDEEIDRAVFGPPAELTPQVSVIGY